MATFLFWNLNSRRLEGTIATLCHDHNVDVLILAEAGISQVALLEALNDGQSAKFKTPFNLSPRLLFFIKYPHDSLRSILDEGGIAIRHLTPPLGRDILLVALHLQSKLHQTEKEQIFQAVRVAKAIQDAELRVGHTRTLVIGDLNMNPFEDGMVGADGFHAVMDKTVARRKNRTVQGELRNFFYNPMWGRMGDNSSGPLGTYYYNNSSQVCFFWNTFDQIMMRPELLDYFSDNDFRVITSARSSSLLSQSGAPDQSHASDHLPILVTLTIEREN